MRDFRHEFLNTQKKIHIQHYFQKGKERTKKIKETFPSLNAKEFVMMANTNVNKKFQSL